MRNETLLQSAKTLSLTMSAPINLIEGGRGILMICPIYRDMQTKGDLSGFFIAVVKIEELLKKEAEDEFFNKAVASASIMDTQLPQNEGLLFSYECCERASDISHESTINFASRSWSVKAYASNYFVHAQFTKYPIVLLVLLLGITSLAAFGTFMMLKRHETLVEANEEMRRFANVAITREERIAELKKIIQEQNEAKEATHG